MQSLENYSIDKYFNKGSEIVVEGQLGTETWEKDGQKQSKTLLNVEKVHFCGKKADTSDAAPTTPATTDDGFMNVPDGIEEELPFK